MLRKGKLENEIVSQIIKFQRELLGKGPSDAQAFIIEDMIILRLKGVLTTEEKHLAQTDQGRQVVKQMRQILRENFAADAEEIIARITGCSVISSHCDISTKTGERVEIYILDRNLEDRFKPETSKSG